MTDFRIIHVSLTVMLSAVATFALHNLYGFNFGFLVITFLLFTAGFTLAFFILSFIINQSENRKYTIEMRAFKAESEKLGFDMEDVQTAKYDIRSYLVDHPASTTADIFENVKLPLAFIEDKESIEAFRLGGLIGLYRYGQDPDTKKWYAIRDSALVRKQYRRFQRYIKSRAYKRELVESK